MGIKHYTEVYKIGYQFFRAAIEQTTYWEDGKLVVKKVELNREMVRSE